MVERFHRQLKAALKTQPNPAAWMDSLSASKPLSKRTAAEKLGVWYYPSPTRRIFHSIRVPPRICPTRPILLQNYKPTFTPFVQSHPDLPNRPHTFLMDCQHVHIYSSVKIVFESACNRLTITKPFTIALRGRNDSVSIDHLKLAHLDTNVLQSSHSTHSTSQTASPTTTRHSPTSTPTTRSCTLSDLLCTLSVLWHWEQGGGVYSSEH